MTKTPAKHSLTFIRSWQIDYFMKKILVNLHRVSFLLLSVVLFSCENPTDIGFDFDGNANGVSVYTDTLGVTVSTILSDSAVNGNSNYILSGLLNDPELGNIKAIAYFQPSLVLYATSNTTTGIDTLTVKANPVADSLRLRIVSSGLIYGDTASRSFFNVYRLKNPLNNTKNYNGTELVEYEGQSLARFGVNSSSFKNATYDSLKAVFVSLPKEITQEILDAAPTAGASNAKFSTAIKGFAIVPENSNKAIYSFTTGPYSGSTSTLIANWHYQGDTTKYIYQFDINGPRHTGFDFNRSGKSLATLVKNNNEINSKLTGGLTYVQGGSGISTKMNFDNVNKLGSNIRISKAVLEFSLKPESVNILYPKVYNFVLSEVTSSNQQSRNAANSLMYYTPIGTDLSGVVYTLVDSSNTLTMDITNYVQKITNKTNKSNGLMIMPAIATSTGNGLIANDNLRRAVFLKPKLKLYYTKY